jgi:hypothetical protein
VAAYYREREIPFDRERGLDVGRVLREAPDWANAQALPHPERVLLLRRLEGGGPLARLAALETLAAHAWRIGDWSEEVDLDARLLTALPEAYEPRRRRVDGLLQLGRNREALREARELTLRHPDAPEGAYLLDAARDAVRRARPGRGRRLRP